MAKSKKKEDNKKSKKAKKVTTEGKFDHPLYGFTLPTFKAPRGPIEYPSVPDFHTMRGGDHMNISRIANVASLVALGAAVLGQTLFGHAGLELVAAGLFLHAGADTREDVLS